MTNDITIIKAGNKQDTEKGIEVCLKEENIRDNAKSARDLFSSLQGELDDIEDDLKDGLSYLDMKNDTLLSYMIDFCNIVLHKVRGEAISGHPSVERSVYYRVILEKIKAIDQRLAYQLNKVITMPDDADGQEQGVNVNNLDVDLGSDDDDDDATVDTKHVGQRRTPRNQDDDDDDVDDDDEEDDEDDDEDEDDDDDDESEENDVSVNSDDDVDKEDKMEDESDIEDDDTKPTKDLRKNKTARGDAGSSGRKPVGIYKPPKLRSVAYNDGSEKVSRRRRDYNEFYQDDNDDIQDIIEESRTRRDDERTRYEEENYTRLPSMNPKKAKRKLREQKAKSKASKKFKGSKSKRR